MLWSVPEWRHRWDFCTGVHELGHIWTRRYNYLYFTVFLIPGTVRSFFEKKDRNWLLYVLKCCYIVDEHISYFVAMNSVSITTLKMFDPENHPFGIYLLHDWDAALIILRQIIWWSLRVCPHRASAAAAALVVFFGFFVWIKVHFVEPLIAPVLDFVYPSSWVSNPEWISRLHSFLLAFLWSWRSQLVWHLPFPPIAVYTV